MSGPLGRPRLHLRATVSTNDRARALAATGAPHGTLVTAGEQSAGRGRQGRTWAAPPGQALLCSLLLRDYDALLPLRAGLAVADLAGDAARVKWPNDVLLEGRKLAGILVEARPRDGWAVLGIGVNAAVDLAALPPDVRDRAATLGRAPRRSSPPWTSCSARSSGGSTSRPRRRSTPCARATRCAAGPCAGRAARAPARDRRRRRAARPARRRRAAHARRRRGAPRCV